jgi:hypothetical protein
LIVGIHGCDLQQIIDILDAIDRLQFVECGYFC